LRSSKSLDSGGSTTTFAAPSLPEGEEKELFDVDAVEVE
jgi:hypothetical protein